MNELGGVNVGKKSCINQKLVAWEVRDLCEHTSRVLQAILNSGDHVSGFMFMNEAPGKCWFLVSSFSGFA